MAKGSASELLVRKARQDLRSCEAYLNKHFARPSSQIEKKAKALAVRHIHRLAKAIRDRDATAIGTPWQKYRTASVGSTVNCRTSTAPSSTTKAEQT